MALLNSGSKCMLPRADPALHSSSSRLSAHALLRRTCPLTARPFTSSNGSRAARNSRSSKLTCNAVGFLQSLFSPKSGGASGPDPRAQEIVEQLIELTEGTDAGAKVSEEGREQISELVGALTRYSIRNPVRSPLLWGEYEVLYSSKPSAVGGPLRKGPGPLVFAGQNARQILTPPNELLNYVEFKTLGLLPGYSKQFGTITPSGGDAFVLNITKGEIKTGFGGPIIKEFDIQRKIQILYLDETLRIVKFLPSDLQDDEEEASGEPSEEILFVFRRLDVEEEEEEQQAEADEDDEVEAPRSGSQRIFGFDRSKQESAATQAEKQARQSEPPRGSSRVVARQAAPAQSAQASAAEQAKRQAEAAKAAERQKAEAAKAEEAKKAAAIRELLAELSEEVKERQEAAREALKELKDVERSNASTSLKAAAAARAQIERVQKETEQVAEAAAAAAAEKRAAEERLRAAAAAVKEAEAALRSVRK